MIPLLLLLAVSASAQVSVVVSSASGDRMAAKPPLKWSTQAPKAASEIAVDASRRFQTMEGFGATFNEAGLMALNQLPKDAQETVLHAMFGRNNAGWTLMKAPVAACDFASAGPWYTYDDTPGDVGLKSFSIARDLKPNGMATFIKRAKQHGEFRIHSTTDYPPDWMLDAKMSLKPEFYPAFARYLLKYVEAYRAQGINIDWVSPFNEPQYIYCKIPYTGIRDFIRDHLGPLFASSGVKTKLQTSDAHNRDTGLKEFPTILNDPKARKYISTMPLHGYQWEKQGSGAMSKLHAMYPEISIWQSEVCYAKPIDKRPMPVRGFDDGDRWGRMIMADIQNWTSGWIYWNAILDEKGGPWLVSVKHEDPDDNSQHPAVIIDSRTKQVEYTGLYWYLAHFSRYVRPGAVRIGSSGGTGDLHFVAFRDGASTVLEVINSSPKEQRFTIRDGNRAVAAVQPARSIATYTW